MKKKIRTACLLLVFLLLTSCGSTESAEKSGAASDNAPSVEKSAPATAPTPGDLSDVENNGGHYVRVGGKVYFRKYGAKALENLAMFGEFTDGGHVTGYESEIVAYDPQTGETETAFTDTGYGGLYVGDGGFYLQERINGADYVVWYSADGKDCETVGEGTLLGFTDGGLLAIEQSAGDGSAFSLYRDKKQAGYFISEFPLIFAGLSDEGLFLIRVEYETETDEGAEAVRTLWQLPPDSEGTLLRLGTFPDADVMCSTEPEQLVSSGLQIGLVVGYYAGSGHFLNDFVVVTAAPGIEDSLYVKDVPREATDDEFMFPKLTVDDDQSIVAVPYLPGALQIGWDEDNNGDLRLYDGAEWATLKAGFCPDRTEGYGFEKIVEDMEYVGGAAYVTLALAHASPLDDIGWRSAYALLDMLYLVVPAPDDVSELACVEYDTVLQGNVWLQDGLQSLLWQQSTFDPDVWQTETDFAFLIPVAPGAVWEYKDEILSEASYAAPEGEPEYYGYPVPEAGGQTLYVRLNRDGEAAFITRKAPDALLTIDVGVPEAELSDTVANIELTRRPSDEDTPWYWSRLTALEDGVTVLIRRTPDNENATEELAMQDGLFVPGSTLFRRVLNKGESVGLYASLPWHPEICVAVMRNGLYGEYIFGEDNYLREEPVNGRYAQKILAGYKLEDRGVVGEWLYRNEFDKEHTMRLSFFDDNTLALAQDGDPRWLNWKTERLHAEEWETPDLLCLEADDPDTVAALRGMSGSVGDYYVERFRTDGETILRLSQVNNGDAALDMLVPHQAQWMTEFTLHSYVGAAEPVAPLRNIVLTAEIVKVDAENNVVWLQEAVARYETEDMSPTFRANPYAHCVACPLASAGLLKAFEDCRDPEYPMKTFQVTIDRGGFVAKLENPPSPDAP